MFDSIVHPYLSHYILFQDLSNMFNRRTASLSQGFNQIRLVFDRYIDGSLKSRTRHKRTGGDEVRYHISDETNIENIPLKKLLSHISTKQDLT